MLIGPIPITSQGIRRGRGDAEVDAVKAVVNIEERRRYNRGGNGRVNAKVDAVKLHEPRRGLGLPDLAMCWDECTHRCCQYWTDKVEGLVEKVSMTVAAHRAVG